MVKKLFFITLVFGLTLSLAGCGNFFLSSDQGSLAIYLADLPANEVEEVNVTLSSVQVKKDDQPWKTINEFDEEEGKFNLLDLIFEEELLGQEYLDPGTYTQIRLILEAPEVGNQPYSEEKSYIKKKSGETIPLFVPSGAQTGLKINHNFTIEAGTLSELILDVDVQDLLVQAGESDKVILSPTSIKVLDKQVTGAIKGQVLNEDQEPIKDKEVTIEVFEKDADPEEEDPVEATIAWPNELGDDPAGSFKIRGLFEGEYDLVIKADDYETAIEEGISVSKGETTIIEDPIILKLKE